MKNGAEGSHEGERGWPGKPNGLPRKSLSSQSSSAPPKNFPFDYGLSGLRWMERGRRLYRPPIYNSHLSPKTME
jgi:hypothetical protein